MPRPLLPERFVQIPASLLYDKNLSPVVRDTWAQLRGLAWGLVETPELSITQIGEITGKHKSALYEHMRLLQSRGDLSWRTGSKPGIIVVYGFRDEPIHHSGKQEKPYTSSNPLIPPDDSSSNKSRVKKIHKEDGAVRKTGKVESKSKADERTKHPAIQAIFGITGRYPKKDDYDILIGKIGDKPDGIKLAQCWAIWHNEIPGVKKSFSAMGYGWAVDWYINGIPEKYCSNGNKKYSLPSTPDDDDDHTPAEPPPEPSRDEQLWRTFCDLNVPDLSTRRKLLGLDAELNGDELIIFTPNQEGADWCNSRILQTASRYFAGHDLSIRFMMYEG